MAMTTTKMVQSDGPELPSQPRTTAAAADATTTTMKKPTMTTKLVESDDLTMSMKPVASNDLKPPVALCVNAAAGACIASEGHGTAAGKDFSAARDSTDVSAKIEFFCFSSSTVSD